MTKVADLRYVAAEEREGGDVMLVTSRIADASARQLRSRRKPRRTRNGVLVTASQCATVARLLREAEPTICNGVKQERPGFIDPADQEGDTVLVLRIGVLPSALYRIDRRGRIADNRPQAPAGGSPLVNQSPSAGGGVS